MATSLFGFIFSASGPIVSMCVIAVWLVRRPSSTAARRVAIIVAAFFGLSGITIVPYALSRMLSFGYHPLRPDDVPAGTTGVVLLGGGDLFIDGWTDTITVTTPIEAERVLEAARVFRLIAPKWIISSGGRPNPNQSGDPSGVTMRDELVALGIPASRIVVESKSRNTHENAAYVAPLLRSLAVDRVILVTSETHMRRSLGAFRAVGVTAIPAVARGEGWPSRWHEWLPNGNGLERSGAVARELGGIPYYWLRGWWRS
jgi:uncharacterized SAM-binding protein YcdF (DUF218 family)